MRIGLRAGLAITPSLVMLTLTLTTVRADDAIKPGKWQYTMTLQMPDMPQLPPGVKLPNGVRLGRGGMTVTRTSCVTSADPTEELRKLQTRVASKGQCNTERLEHAGGTVTWAMTCARPEATVHIEGTAHYSGQQMEADIRSRIAVRGAAAQQTSAHVTGRYRGPCDGG
jgi:hypothetical protein